jgi:formate-dependent nitrite reductase cytochrome c552 subunit
MTLLQGISPQLESNDVPFSQKTKLAKILLSQAGIKDHAVLEDVFSQMDSLDSQNVDTGEKNTLVDMSQANADSQHITPDLVGHKF